MPNAINGNGIFKLVSSITGIGLALVMAFFYYRTVTDSLEKVSASDQEQTAAIIMVQNGQERLSENFDDLLKVMEESIVQDRENTEAIKDLTTEYKFQRNRINRNVE